ncbi:MAG: EAL domain-containing protein [Magnetococcales bacterium]|nr:EAL domain-containing protein [Magnetococcales bacterium]
MEIKPEETSSCRLGGLQSSTPLVLLGIILSLLFGGEMVIMLVLGSFNEGTAGWQTAFLDGALLTALLFPPLYLFFYRPLTCLVESRERSLHHTRQLLEELEVVQSRFGSLTNAVMDAIIAADQEGRIIFWNRGAELIFGYTEEEIAALSLTALMPERYRPQHQEGIDRVVREKKSFPMHGYVLELEGLRRDGTEFPLEMSLATWLEQDKRYFAAIIRDVSDKHQAKEALSIATSVFSDALTEVDEQVRVATRVFENALEGVLVSNMEGIIQSVNPAFTHITGYESEEVVGHPVRILYSDRHDAQFFQEMQHSLTKVGRWRGEIWCRRKTGEAIPQLFSSLVIAGGQSSPPILVSVFSDLTEIKRSQQELQYRTFHDALTGLPNRELFFDRLHKSLQQAMRSRRKLALVMFDLDFFKRVNDRVGFSGGDLVLRRIADRIREGLREADTIGRLGGDGFSVLLHDITGVPDLVEVTRKMRTLISTPIPEVDPNLMVTASFGLTLFPDDGTSDETLMTNAELAMKRAKGAGRDTFQFYTSEMGVQAANRIDLETRLRRAMDRREFVLHYQLKVDARDKRPVGMEALIRWNQPGIGLTYPLDFIPLAEETGLITSLGQWVIQEVVSQLGSWYRAGKPLLRVAANVSSRQFQESRFLESVAGVLVGQPFRPELLELELTESLIMEDVEQAVRTMEALRSLGVFISIDDFGTGYSSLAYLKRFPIHALKIDRSFVRDVPADTNDAAIVSAITSMAHQLSLRVVAEGAETEEQVNFLVEKGCDEIQGYYFSRPLPAEGIMALVEELVEKDQGVATEAK